MMTLVEDLETLGTLKLNIFVVVNSVVEIEPALVLVSFLTGLTGEALEV
jgi:hypothetical protein